MKLQSRQEEEECVKAKTYIGTLTITKTKTYIGTKTLDHAALPI